MKRMCASRWDREGRPAAAGPPAQDVVLLVENQAGYANLCRLLSRVHDEPDSDLATLLGLIEEAKAAPAAGSDELEMLRSLGYIE